MELQSRVDLHKPKMLILQFHTPKIIILQFHTSNVWKNANQTTSYNFKKSLKGDSN